MSVGALFRRGGRFRGCESTSGVSELGFTTSVVYMAYIAGY